MSFDGLSRKPLHVRNAAALVRRGDTVIVAALTEVADGFDGAWVAANTEAPYRVAAAR